MEEEGEEEEVWEILHQDVFGRADRPPCQFVAFLCPPLVALPADTICPLSNPSELFPSFENVLAFMGSAPAFLVSVILPLLAKKIYLLDNSPEGKEKDAARRHILWSVEGLGDWVLIWLGVLGAGLGVWGVIVR